jgi:hypothetical protein
MALSHVFDRLIGTIRFVTLSAGWRAKRGFLVLAGNISPAVRYRIADFDRLAMFGGGKLNASRYSSFFGARIVIFGWYTWGAVVGSEV